MRQFEVGCIGVPRGDGTYFSTVYDVEGHGSFVIPPSPQSCARMVINFASEEEANRSTPKIIKALNALKLRA